MKVRSSIMRSSMLCALALAAVTSTVTFAQSTQTTTATDGPAVTEETQGISAADKSQIAADVLCQNIPALKDPKQAPMIYSNYIEDVSELFGNNAQDIASNVIGINKDYQMSYTLTEPINVVGIEFDTVNINRLKDINSNYYQITASKPLTDVDKGNIKNIPQNDHLTVSTKDQQLEIICNVKTPVVK